jgi:cytochrome b6-f complex iron-sulfur subunit
MEDSVLSRRQVTRAGLVAAAGGAAVAACSSTAADTHATPAGTNGAVLAALSDVPVGSAVAAKGDGGAPVIVAQPTAGTAVAFSAVCTHMGCQVAPAGQQLNCPCHGSQYDAGTGKVLRGPATRPLPPVEVHVADGHVVTGPA